MTILSQLAIAVNNIEEAKGLFELLTEKKVSPPKHVEQQKVNVAFIEMGDTKIELLEPVGDDTPISKFLEKRGGGMHHMGIMTPDLDGLIRALRERGVRTLGEPSIGAEGHRVVFLHPKDTFGVLIELEEEPESEHKKK